MTLCQTRLNHKSSTIHVTIDKVWLNEPHRMNVLNRQSQERIFKNLKDILKTAFKFFLKFLRQYYCFKYKD